MASFYFSKLENIIHVSGMIISIIMLFENRSSLITKNKFKIKKISNRLLWIMVNFFGCIGLMAPIFLNLPDQVDAKMAILKVSFSLNTDLSKSVFSVGYLCKSGRAFSRPGPVSKRGTHFQTNFFEIFSKIQNNIFAY